MHAVSLLLLHLYPYITYPSHSSSNHSLDVLLLRSRGRKVTLYNRVSLSLSSYRHYYRYITSSNCRRRRYCMHAIMRVAVWARKRRPVVE